MKRFTGFVIKEFFHIFRDYRTLLILFGMPAVQLLLFGYVITNEIKDARIAIFDPSTPTTSMPLERKWSSDLPVPHPKSKTDFGFINSIVLSMVFFG